MVAADARRDSGSRRSTRCRSERHGSPAAPHAQHGGKGGDAAEATLARAAKPRELDTKRQRQNMEGRKCGQVRRGKFNDEGTNQTPVKV